MRVSVCIPATRASAFTVAALGAYNQSHRPAEILIHDCSREGILDKGEFNQQMRNHLGIRVHQGDPSISTSDSRNYLAREARSNFLWFIDDDVFPEYDCLENLLKTHENLSVSLVTSTLHDVVPIQKPWGGREWNLGRQPRTRDSLLSWCGTDCFTVRRNTWLTAKANYHIDARGGEDIYATSFISERDGVGVSAGARALHLRTEQPTWTRDPLDREWLDEHIKPRLSGYASFLQDLGER